MTSTKKKPKAPAGKKQGVKQQQKRIAYFVTFQAYFKTELNLHFK